MPSFRSPQCGQEGELLGADQPRRRNQCGHELGGTGQLSGRGPEDRNSPLPFSMTNCQPRHWQMAASEPTVLSSLPWSQLCACRVSLTARAPWPESAPGLQGLTASVSDVHGEGAALLAWKSRGAAALGRLGAPLHLSPCSSLPLARPCHKGASGGKGSPDLGPLLFSCQNPGPRFLGVR